MWPIRVHRGERQGCALSGKHSPCNPSFRKSVQVLVVCFYWVLIITWFDPYADDVVVLIKDQEDVNTLANVTEKFSVSSARLNWEKNEVLAVGEWHESLHVLPKNLI